MFIKLIKFNILINKRKNKAGDESEILNEIKILKSLDHPKILKVLDLLDCNNIQELLKEMNLYLKVREFINEQSGVKGWGEAMNEAFAKLRDRLKSFKPTLTFTDLSTKTMEEFKVELSRTMYNDSILKRLSYLRTFVKWAKLKKYTVNEETNEITLADIGRLNVAEDVLVLEYNDDDEGYLG